VVTRVLDTSVVAKWFLQEAGSDKADRYLDELTDGYSRVVVPSLLYYELAAVFWEQREHGLGDTEARSLWAGLRALPITVVSWDKLLPGALGLAFRSGVSPCDATFVLLARDVAADLITADLELYEKIHERCAWVKMLT
jgi:predicted nucleic acid-binding protein